MMRKKFGPSLDEIDEVPLQHRRDPGVQFLPSGAQQRAVGGVLHQRMLEEVRGMRSDAAAKQQSSIVELTQGELQLSLVALRHELDLFVGKLAAEHCTDLCNLLGRWPEPVQASHQRRL